MATRSTKTLSRKARLQSGTGGMVAGTGVGAFLLHLAQGHPTWAAIIQFLAPALSILTSTAVIWLRFEWDEFVRRTLVDRELKSLRKRQTLLRDVIEQNASPAIRKKAEKLLNELDTEMLTLVAE